MPKPKQICETSLRWILAVRLRAKVHQYNTNLLYTSEKFPEVHGDAGGDYGHSGGSLHWTIKQAKTIDQIGLKKWMRTDDALGYGYAVEGYFGLR